MDWPSGWSPGTETRRHARRADAMAWLAGLGAGGSRLSCRQGVIGAAPRARGTAHPRVFIEILAPSVWAFPRSQTTPGRNTFRFAPALFFGDVTRAPPGNRTTLRRLSRSFAGNTQAL